MKNNTLIPISIVIAGFLIGAGVLLGGGNTLNTETQSATRENDRHVWGDPDAAITIVEFSDYECPFCGRLHPTLKQIVEESEGGINWEYRHFPLPNHKNAESAAMASECISEFAGNDAFWEFSDSAFQNQRSLGASFYQSEAARFGIDPASFESCMRDEEKKEMIINDQLTGVSLGGNGTPFSVIVYEDGTMRPVSGALPYAQWLPLLQK